MSTCIKTGLRYLFEDELFAADMHVSDTGAVTIISTRDGFYVGEADVEVELLGDLAPGIFYGILSVPKIQLVDYVFEGSGVRLYDGQSVLVVRR